MKPSRLWWLWTALLIAQPGLQAAPGDLRLSLYATAGDILRHLATDEQRARALRQLGPLPVSRIFLEGRRGDEYVPPALLRTVRGFLEEHGIETAGGIATVPGSQFGVRQNEGLGWLNWQNPETRADVAAFFTENAPLFEELIVDDFFCTGDTSPESGAARGTRSWGEYRRDLLVSLIDPIMLRPARAANPDIRLILKYPQWYDRFHLFGYDPERMSVPFDQIWVGTEVRDPATRRMGFVQPTEGYMNFRWLTSVAGDKVTGAWFDHIECGATHFVDQAFQSVLAGARELTLFRFGDVMEGHPGDSLLAQKWGELLVLAGRVRHATREGVVFYKPVNSDPRDNLYLADYLGMLGLPILPEASFPSGAGVVFLGAQAAADPAVLTRARAVLQGGGTVIVTPAFLRAAGGAADELAGLEVGAASEPVAATQCEVRGRIVTLPMPLDADGAVRQLDATVRIMAAVGDRRIPLLATRPVAGGHVVCLNIRTFSEDDFRQAGEWLLAPRALGWSQLADPVANEVRALCLAPLGVRFEAPSGVALHLFGSDRCVYNFHDVPIRFRPDGEPRSLAAKGWVWLTGERHQVR
ncbi:MAG: hypothetical protein H7A45_21885 [Verrucomicrobiales bacterium]|nr:hypothetical protein [Verrucomicrobiales bacterium]MCP5519900.1 hypothetical protein [Verrucomicrobiales bacterium]